MEITEIMPVGKIAVEVKGAIPFMEELKLDYCCGGRRSLKEACELAGVPVKETLDLLGKIQARSNPDTVFMDWTNRPLVEFLDYIVEKHHVYTRTQTSRLLGLAEKVVKVHGEKHPELLELRDKVGEMGRELDGHMAKEEQVVFAFLRRLEEEREAGNIAQPVPQGPVLSQPLKVLMWEHGVTGEGFLEIHRLTNGLTPPEGACMSFKGLYEGIRELEADVHQHIHLENNILFPKLTQMGLAESN